MSENRAFIGREKEIAQLQQFYRERKCALVLGEAGIGKTALLQQMCAWCPMLLCEETSTLSHICESLEKQLDWPHSKLHLIARKNRLLAELEKRSELVVFDNVASTPPRVARFIAHLIEKIPLWIASRSPLAKEIGHVWPYLNHFQRIEIGALTFHESAALIEAEVARGSIQADAAQHARQLHQIANGNPRALGELLNELADRKYNMDSTFGFHLLELDRRIHETKMLAKPEQSEVKDG